MPFTLTHHCTSFSKNIRRSMLSSKAMLELPYLSCESKGLSSTKWQSCLFNLNSSPFCNLLVHLERMGKQQYLALMFLAMLISLGSGKVCTFCTWFGFFWGINGRIMGRFKGLRWDFLFNERNVQKQKNGQPAMQLKTMGSSRNRSGTS